MQSIQRTITIPRDEVQIPREKLTHYLLAPRLDDDKSKFLAQAGFILDNPDVLEQAIHQLAQDNDAILDRQNEYGEYYRVMGDLVGVGGQILKVVTIWIVRANGGGKFSFVTLKPWEEKNG